MQKHLLKLITLLALALSAACTPAAQPTPVITAAPPIPAPITLTDGRGVDITLDAPADRILSLAPSNTELLFAVGAGGQIAGRDSFSDFPAEAFDAALNIQASHCYPRQADFFKSAYRVLRPGGHLLWADFCPRGKVPALEPDMTNAGFRVADKTDITEHVLRALNRLSGRYRTLVTSLTPKMLHPAMLTFAATEGSGVYNSFVSGERVYWSYHLEKPVGSPEITVMGDTDDTDKTDLHG